ncbi:facilitated trehalose transporter Tret1 isoform X2 [Plutella xylostella]|uniref:facilitated trehalose transporter Tret1 isoform X2 n=1 Tax=Plutella xylostella TaxID=51655 RepID=UPI0020327CEE|nr:facilitated trehalose transporter Tret1 isoform X2 [Plutella xylostella]
MTDDDGKVVKTSDGTPKTCECVTENKSKQWLTGLVADITIFTYGMQTGWMSPSIQVLQGPNSPSGYPLSDYEISWIAGTVTIVAVFFCLGFSVVCDRYGRRMSLVLVAVTQAIGWIIKLISAKPVYLIVSQVFVGIASAGVYTCAPLYIKEISSDSIRGSMASAGIVLQSVGALIMFGIAPHLEYHTVLWLVTWIPVVNVLLLLKIPETPPYLVKRGKIDEARTTIASLVGLEPDSKSVNASVECLTKAQEYFDTLPKISLKRAFADKATRRAFYIGLFVVSLLDFGGNFVISIYASVIIKNSGVTVRPELQALSLPAIMIIGSLVSTVTVEKYGRKPLLISSLIINGLPMTILGILLILPTYGFEIAQWIPVLCVIITVFAYGAGVLPIPYIILMEIFNFEVRAMVFGFYVTYGWFLCFLQTIIFTPISQALGMHVIFFLFSAVNIISAVCCAIWLPETKGKSLEKIQDELCAR